MKEYKKGTKVKVNIDRMFGYDGESDRNDGISNIATIEERLGTSDYYVTLVIDGEDSPHFVTHEDWIIEEYDGTNEEV